MIAYILVMITVVAGSVIAIFNSHDLDLGAQGHNCSTPLVPVPCDSRDFRTCDARCATHISTSRLRCPELRKGVRCLARNILMACEAL